MKTIKNQKKKEKNTYYQKTKEYYLTTYWKNNDGKDFYRPNGFDCLPERIYCFFCKEIDKDGKILDLGCGNGLMLRYLMETLKYKLIPYGVDFLEQSIKQAKEIIHPQYAKNFVVSNVIDYSFQGGPFDFIFCPLSHVHPKDRQEYLKKVRKNCKKGGKVIFYEYDDVVNAQQIKNFSDLPELKNLKITQKKYPGVLIGVWQKK